MNVFFLKYILAFSILLLVSFNSNAQSPSILSKTLDSLVDVKSSEAFTVGKKLERAAKKASSDLHLSKAYSVLAKLYFDNKNYTKSINYFEKELKIREKGPHKGEISEAYYNLGSTCLKLKKNRKAEGYFQKSLDLASDKNNLNLIKANYNALVITNEKLLDYKDASIYMKKLFELNQGDFQNQINLYKEEVSIQKQEVKVQKKIIRTKAKELKKTQKNLDTAKIELKESSETIDILEEDTLRKKFKISSLNFQSLLKDKEIDLKEKELAAEKRFTILLIIGISSIALLAIYIFYLMLSNKRMNRLLMHQKEEIQKQNNSIKHSIQYASRIQQATLPKPDLFKQSFSDYFIFFKPRDIVSGDFYFIRKINQYIVFSAVDCTGHGVPGAFMSMLGIAYLNDIIQKKEVTKASDILELLRTDIKSSLQQQSNKGEPKDGMDMAICVVDTQNLELQYSGAHNPFLLIRNQELTEIKGDRMPVGIHRKETEFTNHNVQLQEGDQIYLASDGFQDQIGGEKRKKYMSKTFKNLLLKHSNHPMPKQRELIEQEYLEWKSEFNQIDDILIIGVKI